MRIVSVASEVAPFSKTGGLGDVGAALPAALAARGHKVVTISPRYAGAAVADRTWERRGSYWFWLFGEHHEAVYFVSEETDNLAHVLIANPMFDRGGIYHDPAGVFGDNQRRFAFLSRAALEVPRMVPLWDGVPMGEADILHAHDWQGALAPVFLNALYKPVGLYPTTRSVLTIHNAAHQGVFSMQGLGGLDLSARHAATVEFGGALNTLKAGIVAAHKVTAVSPTFAGELQTPSGGFGLDAVFRAKAATGDFSGVLNGIDQDDWDPSTDRFLAAGYSMDDLSGKAVCKAALQREMGLPVRPDVPLFGIISRLDWQKGMELLLAGSPDILTNDIQLVVLGLGDPKLHDGLLALQGIYPDRVRVRLAKDFELAHRIYAGSDFFVVPSLFEPCGLTQMYAMRYGAPPVVRSTGGLVDSVEHWDPATGQGTGWRFDDFDPRALATAMGWAAHTFATYPEAYAQAQKNGMARDWSWSSAAAHFEAIYADALST